MSLQSRRKFKTETSSTKPMNEYYIGKSSYSTTHNIFYIQPAAAYARETVKNLAIGYTIANTFEFIYKENLHCVRLVYLTSPY